MLRFLATIALLLQVTITFSADYIYPVENVSRFYSGNFGEMRGDHFHSGVDIKTESVVGKRVVSASDGYVSRISLSPYGYGLALYIAHPKLGTTTVYGHLLKLRDDLQQYLENERYRTKQHSLNLYFTASQFPVKMGDFVAYSGNSGSSGGPHVHFEVRDSAQRPMNPVTEGIITPTDSVRPRIFNIYYSETETVDGVCYARGVSKYPVVETSLGEYKLADKDVMWVGREGYFILETIDKRDGVTNTFGVYALYASIDDKPFFNFQSDKFSFSHTRFCNAISYYPLQTSTRTEHFRMKRLEGVPRELIKYTDNNGVIKTLAGDSKTVVIKVLDDMKNSSKLTFTLKGKDDADCFRATPADPSKIIRPSKSSTFNSDSLRVSIPPAVVYEPEIFTSKISDVTMTAPAGVKFYSRKFEVMDPNTPLQSYVTLSIKADIPLEEQSKVMMLTTGRSGRTSVINATYSAGWVTAKTRTTGSFFVAVDTVAPVITPLFENGASLAGSSTLKIKVSDNYSGLNTYSATIDGKWIALDLDGSTLIHSFRDKGDGAVRELTISVTDRCNNETTLTRSFTR